VREEVISGSIKGVKLERAIEYLTYAMILLFYTGKVFQVFTVLIDILFIVLVYVRKEKVFFQEHQKLIYAFSVLFVYFAIQSLFAVDIRAALLNSLGMVRFVILFFALWYVFDSSEKVKRLIYSVYIIIGLLFLDASYQYVTGKDIFGHVPVGVRLTAWDSKAKLGMFVAVFAGIVVASVEILQKKWLAWLSVIILFLIVVFSGNKGPVVYLSGAVFVVLLLSKTYRKYLFPTLTAIAILLATAIMTNDGISARFHQFTNPLSAKNTSGRNQIYETSIEMIKAHPLLGVGARNFRVVFPDYYLIVYNKKEKKDYYDEHYLTNPQIHTHGMFFAFLVNWGLIGTLMFFYILYLIYKKHIRNNDIALLASIGLIYCVAPFNFGNTIARSQWQFYIFLTLAFIVILGNFKYFKKKEV